MPPDEDAEQRLDQSREVTGDSAVADVARTSQEKPPDLKDKEAEREGLRKHYATASSADLPVFDFSSFESSAPIPEFQGGQTTRDMIDNTLAGKSLEEVARISARSSEAGYDLESPRVADAKAWERLRDDSEVADSREKLEKAAEKIPEPQKTEFLENGKAFEERMATLENDYQKQFEAKGLTPKEAAREAEKKCHQEVKDTYKNIERLLENNDKAPIDSADRILLAEQCMQHAADTKSIAQGNHGTCFATTVETRAYATNPAEATRLIADVATTGSYTAAGKGHITVDFSKDEHSLKKHGESNEVPPQERKDGHRDFASQIFQVTAANVALEQQNMLSHPPGKMRYEQHPDHSGDKPPDYSGERLVDYSKTPPMVQYGMGLDTGSVAALADEISPSNPHSVVVIANSSEWEPVRKALDAQEEAVREIAKDCGLASDTKIELKDPEFCKKMHEAIDKRVGLTDKERQQYHEHVNDGAKWAFRISQQGDRYQGQDPEKMAEFLSWAKSRGDLPVIIAVDTVNEPFWTDSGAGKAGGAGGGHVITITDFDEKTGVCKMQNQWESKSSHEIKVEDLSKATVSSKENKLEVLLSQIEKDRKEQKPNHALELQGLHLERDLGKVSEKDFNERKLSIMQAWSDRSHREGEPIPSVDNDLRALKHDLGKMSDQQCLDALEKQSAENRKDGRSDYDVEFKLLETKLKLGKATQSEFEDQLIGLMKAQKIERDAVTDVTENTDNQYRRENRAFKALLSQLKEKNPESAERIIAGIK